MHRNSLLVLAALRASKLGGSVFAEEEVAPKIPSLNGEEHNANEIASEPVEQSTIDKNSEQTELQKVEASDGHNFVELLQIFDDNRLPIEVATYDESEKGKEQVKPDHK